MKKVLALVVFAPLVACVSGSSGSIDTTGGGDDDGTMQPTDDGISGDIAANTTWSGHVRIVGQTTIKDGVAVTVAAGTTVEMVGSGAVYVNGIFDASGGTKAAPIMIIHGPVLITSNGAATYSYVDHEGGGVHLSGTAMFTATDSKLSNATGGDFLTMGGGTINVTYSTLGETTGATSTHCNLHFDQGYANTVTVTHSNIAGAPYGVMLYGATGADMTFNNWFGNELDISTNLQPVDANLSSGFFAAGAPVPETNATLTLDTLATAMLTDAGPR